LNAGTDEADAQMELKHATAQGNLEAQKAANEKLVSAQKRTCQFLSIINVLCD